MLLLILFSTHHLCGKQLVAHLIENEKKKSILKLISRYLHFVLLLLCKRVFNCILYNDCYQIMKRNMQEVLNAINRTKQTTIVQKTWSNDLINKPLLSLCRLQIYPMLTSRVGYLPTNCCAPWQSGSRIIHSLRIISFTSTEPYILD